MLIHKSFTGIIIQNIKRFIFFQARGKVPGQEIEDKVTTKQNNK